MVNDQNDLEELKENLAKLNKRKKQIEETIEKVEEKEKGERQKPIRTIAIKAHDLFCAWNHTDGCGWYYENIIIFIELNIYIVSKYKIFIIIVKTNSMFINIILSNVR